MKNFEWNSRSWLSKSRAAYISLPNTSTKTVRSKWRIGLWFPRRIGFKATQILQIFPQLFWLQVKNPTFSISFSFIWPRIWSHRILLRVEYPISQALAVLKQKFQLHALYPFKFLHYLTTSWDCDGVHGTVDMLRLGDRGDRGLENGKVTKIAAATVILSNFPP